MSAENVEVVRENIEAVSAAGFDPDIAQLRLHPEMRVHAPAEWPGDDVYEGPDGLAGLLAEWRARFCDLTAHLERVIEDGDSVVALLELRGTSRSSSVDVEWRLGYLASDFADGPPREIRFFMSWEKALAAVGLEARAE